MGNDTNTLEQKLLRIELALEAVNKKLDIIMGVNQPIPTETDEREASRLRTWAAMDKAKFKRLAKLAKQNSSS